MVPTTWKVSPSTTPTAPPVAPKYIRWSPGLYQISSPPTPVIVARESPVLASTTAPQLVNMCWLEVKARPAGLHAAVGMLCSSFIVTGSNTSIDPGLVAVDGTVIWNFLVNRFQTGCSRPPDLP